METPERVLRQTVKTQIKLKISCVYQGFSYLSDVEARGLLNLVNTTLEPSKLGKVDSVYMNKISILN